jgi:formyl-CoA transferase
MVRRADILIENFAPGVMDRLGLGAAVLQQINPRLIYGSSSGYGKSGPYRAYPAMDLVVQAMTGIIAATGHADQPPVKCGAAVCDFSAGIHLYGAIMTALYERERTGKGRVVEVAMQDAIYTSLASNLGMLHARGAEAPARTGNKHGGLGIAPYNAYRALDGWVVINAPGDKHFRSILDVIGRADLADDARFATRPARVANMQAVDDLLEEWTRTRPRAEIARKLLEAAVPAAAVRELAEVVADENMHARGSLQWVDHPTLGRVVLPHSPMVFEGTLRRPIDPSRPLGSDNASVLESWLGSSHEDVEELSRAGAFGSA